MLLRIATTHHPATDLGFLLHKHPDRVQAFELPFGTAHVFYPQADEERCEFALLLEVDAVGLTRGRKKWPGGLDAMTRFAYSWTHHPIGEESEGVSAPSQMGVFTRDG